MSAIVIVQQYQIPQFVQIVKQENKGGEKMCSSEQPGNHQRIKKLLTQYMYL